MSGLAAIEFDIVTPLNAEVIKSHIAHAASLGLSSPAMNHEGREGIDIVASGPSALDRRLGPCTAAVNNALRLFGDEGPTFWIACDPQEIVADFIPEDPPKNTIYLVATKCHPAVFEKLKDRDVQLWQIDDYELQPGILAVPTAISVTLCAINLLAQMGYTRINTWGWDGCFIDGSGYASPQEERADRITVHLGGKQYQTTHTWACEAQDARDQFMRDDTYYSVNINGPGMIGAIVRHFGLAA